MKPRSLFRRAERIGVGAVMAVLALILEKLVVRALKKKGEATPPQEATPITTRGSAIDLDSE